MIYHHTVWLLLERKLSLTETGVKFAVSIKDIFIRDREKDRHRYGLLKKQGVHVKIASRYQTKLGTHKKIKQIWVWNKK